MESADVLRVKPNQLMWYILYNPDTRKHEALVVPGQEESRTDDCIRFICPDAIRLIPIDMLYDTEITAQEAAEEINKKNSRENKVKRI